MIRLCVSGTAFCSGCNPCEQCHIAIMSRVMPKAMIAGGFNESPEMAQSFLQAYMQAFRTLQADIMKAMQEAVTAQQAAAQQAAVQQTAATAATEPAPAMALGGIAQQDLNPSQESPPAETPPDAAAPEPPAEATETLPSEPEPAAPAIIPPPHVEGLTGSQDVPDAPTSDTVPKKHRRKARGLPRSLRRRSS